MTQTLTMPPTSAAATRLYVAEGDSRTLRTRLALRDALAEEIGATGDLFQITVKAVTDRAGVTRRTFYSHFRDIPDLVTQIENETLAEIRPLMDGIAAVKLDELEEALKAQKACPGSVDLLCYFRDRASYLAALLGDGGDPAFAERLKVVARQAIECRAQEGLNLSVFGAIFDYYLTYAISAETGVLIRWLTTGTHESADVMARVMTALMFVRPGDLYGKTIHFDAPRFGLSLLASFMNQGSEENHD